VEPLEAVISFSSLAVIKWSNFDFDLHKEVGFDAVD
jgi:hypothetical protein